MFISNLNESPFFLFTMLIQRCIFIYWNKRNFIKGPNQNILELIFLDLAESSAKIMKKRSAHPNEKVKDRPTLMKKEKIGPP